MTAIQSTETILEERSELWIVMNFKWNGIICCWQVHICAVEGTQRKNGKNFSEIAITIMNTSMRALGTCTHHDTVSFDC
jgi:hypothetical protein